MKPFTLLLAVFTTTISSFIHAAPLTLQKRDTLPEYVLKFAPLAHLHSKESWYPSDISDFLTHVTPKDDSGSSVAATVTFSTIDSLGSNVFLTSNDAVETKPVWTTSTQNKPDSAGLSAAPATIIAVDKGNGIVDAFYFFFYNFDYAKFLDIEFGSHFGDWEHTMVRFSNGVPSIIYLSAHSGGSAYSYSALPATNDRAVTYIALGTHANYATPGDHQHDIPFLEDHTDDGLIWDITQNYRGYWYDKNINVFSSASGAGSGGNEQQSEGTGWLYFQGRWGDKKYADFKHGQYCIAGQCRYSDGPTGPIAKNLGRAAVCQNEQDCTIKTKL